MRATRARFTRRVKAINLNQGSPVPDRFVLQLPHELAPAHIGNCFCEGGVLHHVLDSQALDADRLEPCLGGRYRTNQFRRKVMLSVFAPSSYSRMDDGHTPSLLCSVLRA